MAETFSADQSYRGGTILAGGLEWRLSCTLAMTIRWSVSKGQKVYALQSLIELRYFCRKTIWSICERVARGPLCVYSLPQSTTLLVVYYFWITKISLQLEKPTYNRYCNILISRLQCIFWITANSEQLINNMTNIYCCLYTYLRYRPIFIMKIVHEVQETKKKCKKVQSASMCSS